LTDCFSFCICDVSRKDLLSDYKYAEPPATWDELEKIALEVIKGENEKRQKLQAGDALKGVPFYGFTWQGADAEGLMCNIMEWLGSHGAGNVIEEDGKISFNNNNTVAALTRVRRWIGDYTTSITPVIQFNKAEVN
jgi:trehalose/maltose transport system substrate-binding protein